jgi:hypothetical protein
VRPGPELARRRRAVARRIIHLQSELAKAEMRTLPERNALLVEAYDDLGYLQRELTALVNEGNARYGASTFTEDAIQKAITVTRRAQRSGAA